MDIKPRGADEPVHDEEAYVEPPGWPQWLLDRHGATVLRQADTLRDGDLGGVRTTVYRTAALLVPNDFIADLLDPINVVLQEVGMMLVPPEVSLEDAVAPLTAWLPGDGYEAGPVEREIVSGAALCEHIRSVPRAVGVQRADDDERLRRDTATPVDAWRALRHIRAALRKGKFEKLPHEQREAVERISLDHLVQGAQFGGVPMYDPATKGNALLGGFPGGGYFPEGRHPVAQVPWQPVRDAKWAGRRPVVAVLDTGVCAHPWFTTSPAFTATPPGDGFLNVYVPTVQDINKHIAKVQGFPLTNVLLSGEDGPCYTDPIGSLVNAAWGHGTFIAGLIHQAAPDVDVLSVRVLRADNVGYESDVLLALNLLHARNVEARKEDGSAEEIAARRKFLVDVVSLSLGYYDETWLTTRRALFLDAVKQLVESGVIVLAAAGNDATTRPFLPAALRVPSTQWAGPDVVGVGALNPNGTVSWYGNGGDSVSVRAPGTCLVSTFPPTDKGAVAPTMITHGRQSVDYDDFGSGFAVWSGTSFATPVVAAKLVKDLLAEKDGAVNSIDAGLTRDLAERVVAKLVAEP
ncbi:S8/S53 family peptidase [Saccharothrix sp. NPDC042600]|uniref:S8 family peptidase n=1 Tax=Saccharothrix TaxID=2071 RepID=UPI0033E4FBA3|nr:S8 family serine peptidase [Saccharothrix mutabilis subsp. capreolus]